MNFGTVSVSLFQNVPGDDLMWKEPQLCLCTAKAVPTNCGTLYKSYLISKSHIPVRKD